LKIHDRRNGVMARTLETQSVVHPARGENTGALDALWRWRPSMVESFRRGRLQGAERFSPDPQGEDPDHFADVSLAVIKLMGPGEYVLERPGQPSPGHFGRPCRITRTHRAQRRFADVVTQR